MSGRSRAAAPPAGFTLLEILVVVAVGGLLLAGLTQGLRSGLALWSGQRATLAGFAELNAIDRALRGLIERADPGARSDAPPLAGGAASLRFLTRLPEAGASQRAEVELLVDDRHHLLLRWRPRPHVADAALPAMREDVLLDGVERVLFSYRPDRAGDWLSEWQRPVPPLLVRIQLVFLPGDSRRWPDIVARPMRERDGS